MASASPGSSASQLSGFRSPTTAIIELDAPKHSVRESSFRDSDSWLPFHPGLSARIAT